MDTVEQVIEFVKEWIERESEYEKIANAWGDEKFSENCSDRIFTLRLLLSNIDDLKGP